MQQPDISFMSVVKIGDKRFEPFITSGRIQAVVKKLTASINLKYSGKDPVFVAVLNGSFIFASDLLKQFKGNCQISFVKVASYSGSKRNSRISPLIGLNEQLKGRHVIILEDIIDTGNTLKHVHSAVKKARPASIAVASLFFKHRVYKKSIKIDHCGIKIPDHFIIGYGLDYNGYGRNLRSVYKLKTND